MKSIHLFFCVVIHPGVNKIPTFGATFVNRIDVTKIWYFVTYIPESDPQHDGKNEIDKHCSPQCILDQKLYVCVCVCMYVYIYICIYIFICVCVCACVCVCMCLFVFMCMCMCMCIMCMCMYVRVYVYV